jgi:hypothetical protein
MSPTSYQAAPPRVAELGDQRKDTLAFENSSRGKGGAGCRVPGELREPKLGMTR